MRYLTILLLIPALLLVVGDIQQIGIRYVEIQVLVGTVPLPGASVALDLNDIGVWEEGEQRDWTDCEGDLVFSGVVSIENPGGDDPAEILD